MVEIEFVAAVEDENIEDRLAYLDPQTETLEKDDIPLRLPRHYASSVRHRKYHDIDIITVHVEGGR